MYGENCLSNFDELNQIWRFDKSQLIGHFLLLASSSITSKYKPETNNKNKTKSLYVAPNCNQVNIRTTKQNPAMMYTQNMYRLRHIKQACKLFIFLL